MELKASLLREELRALVLPQPSPPQSPPAERVSDQFCPAPSAQNRPSGPLLDSSSPEPSERCCGSDARWPGQPKVICPPARLLLRRTPQLPHPAALRPTAFPTAAIARPADRASKP